MVRWILMLVAVFAFGLAFTTNSPALMGWSLFFGILCFVSAFFGFVAARMQSVSQEQGSREIDLLLREQATRQRPADPSRTEGNTGS